jgi:cytoskeletal protein CcmA (bactofilin family)
VALFGAEKGQSPEPKRDGVTMSGKTTNVPTLLGKGSEFEGKLTFEGEVRIDGKYTGHISTKDTLVVGESARVSAEISAGIVIINGTVDGIIRASQWVEMHPPARVKGTIETPAMTMEKGVIFEGNTKMEPNKAAPPAPAKS